LRLNRPVRRVRTQSVHRRTGHRRPAARGPIGCTCVFPFEQRREVHRSAQHSRDRLGVNGLDGLEGVFLAAGPLGGRDGPNSKIAAPSRCLRSSHISLVSGMVPANRSVHPAPGRRPCRRSRACCIVHGLHRRALTPRVLDPTQLAVQSPEDLLLPALPDRLDRPRREVGR
jgi:hypothetical protein